MTLARRRPEQAIAAAPSAERSVVDRLVNNTAGLDVLVVSFDPIEPAAAAVKVSHRLYLTVTPAILGVLLMAGLAYWGQYAHTVPRRRLRRRRSRRRRLARCLRGSMRASSRAASSGWRARSTSANGSGDPDELDRIATASIG